METAELLAVCGLLAKLAARACIASLRCLRRVLLAVAAREDLLQGPQALRVE